MLCTHDYDLYRILHFLFVIFFTVLCHITSHRIFIKVQACEKSARSMKKTWWNPFILLLLGLGLLSKIYTTHTQRIYTHSHSVASRKSWQPPHQFVFLLFRTKSPSDRLQFICYTLLNFIWFFKPVAKPLPGCWKHDGRDGMNGPTDVGQQR